MGQEHLGTRSTGAAAARVGWRRAVSMTLADARNWALALLACLILVKLAWVVFVIFDGSLRVRGYEWPLLPMIMSAQHVLVATACFVVYAVLLIAGCWSRPSRVVATVLVAAAQVFLIYWHNVAFRIALYLGTYPTYGFIRESFQGGVAVPSLLAPENLVYNAVAFLLAIAAVVGPIRARRRRLVWPRPRLLAAALAAATFWTAGGLVAIESTRSDLASVHRDSGLFFVREMLEEHVELVAEPRTIPPPPFPREPIFGSTEPFQASRLVSNLDRWRQTRRNVVLVVLESTPARQASFHGPVEIDGEPRDTTPVLRGLREHMLLMRNHYTVQPESMDSLFALSCSMYPSPTRASITDINPRIPCTSMSDLLSRNGYVAGLFHSGHFSFYRKDQFFNDRGFEVMYDGHTMPGHRGAYRYRWGVDERVTARAINEFIDDHRDRSFFVQYIPVFPHAPYEVPEAALEVFGTETARDNHNNTIHYVDAAVGTIVEHLRELELLDDTLLVVVSDHGEAFGEHPGNRIHSLFIYDENVHVPLGFHNPLLFSGAPSSDRVSSHVDVLPTIADLLDLQPARSWQGQSLVADGRERPVFFHAIRGRELVGMRDGRWKVIWNRETDLFELYDLVADPGERRDLASRHPEMIGRYRDAMSAWRSYNLDLVPRFGRAEVRAIGEPLARRPMLRSYQPHNYDPMHDQSISGRRLKVGGFEHDLGLGTHAESWYVYDVESAGAARLVGKVGRHRGSGGGTAIAGVFLDGRLAFETGAIRATTPAFGFDLDLAGVRQVALASWNAADGPRADHVDWIDLALVGPAEEGLAPGRTVELDSMTPSGANAGGLQVGRIRQLPRGLLRIGIDSLRSGLLVPSAATVSYDVRALGATRVKGRAMDRSVGGDAPAWVALSFDDREALKIALPGDGEPVAIDVAVPASARLLSIKSAPEEAPGRAVLKDLRVETSLAALTAARRAVAKVVAPRELALASLPPAPPLPGPDDAGWGSLPSAARGSGAALQPGTHWIRAGASVRWELAGLRVTRLAATARAAGPDTCRPTLRLAAGAREVASDALVPGAPPVPLELALDARGRLVASVEGDRQCFIVLEGSTLAP